MRISRTTLILFLANLLAFGLVWRATYSHQQAVVAQRQLFPANIAKVSIADGAERLVIEKRNGLWRVTEPFEWPANIWSVQRLLEELREISPERGFAAAESKANGASLATYGLATPRWSLKVTSETGVTIEAKVGLQPSTRLLFLLTEDGQRILPLQDAMAAALDSKSNAYRVDRIFEIADFEARAVSARQRIKDAESVTSLTSEARPRPGRRVLAPEWRFEAPFDTLADADATSKAVADLANLRAVKFMPLADEISGLSQPSLRLALEGNSKRQVLLVGRPAPGDPALLCAKLEDNTSTFLIEARHLAAWFRPREALAATRPADFEPALVTGFTVTSTGRSITLHRLDGASGEARWEIPVSPGSTATKRREADAKVVNRFLESISQLRAVRQSNPEGGRSGLPAVIALTGAGPTSPHSVELEFGSEKIVLGFSDGPEKGPGTRLVRVKGSPVAAICDVSLLNNGYQNVEPQAWRNRTVAELPQGAKVSGLRLGSRTETKVLGEARLGPDGNWAGNGRLDPASARRIATAFAEVKAAEFPGRDIGSGGWKYELRVTDQSATGAAAASETFRTYLCSAPLGARSLLMRDEADGDDFLLEPALAEILIPLLSEAGR